MVSKVWCLVYVEKSFTDIIQNVRKDIHFLLWSYRKVRVNRNTITLPTEMAGLAIMKIETQCEVIQCSILAKLIKEKKSKENMDWSHVVSYNQY